MKIDSVSVIPNKDRLRQGIYQPYTITCRIVGPDGAIHARMARTGKEGVGAWEVSEHCPHCSYPFAVVKEEALRRGLSPRPRLLALNPCAKCVRFDAPSVLNNVSSLFFSGLDPYRETDWCSLYSHWAPLLVHNVLEAELVPYALAHTSKRLVLSLYGVDVDTLA